MRWPNGPECPHCDEPKPYYLATQKRWKCRKCRKQFSVKVGTIFEDSPITLQKWLPALWLICNNKNGVSSWELHRALSVTQKTAWFMLHRLRLAMRRNTIQKLDGGPVEVDETYIGGQKRFMHASKRRRMVQGGKAENKTIVIGFLDRELRQVRARVIPNAKRETLQNEILNLVSRGAKVYTDDAPAYDRWREDFVHEVVNKTESYVRGQVHVNGIENFWSLLKRTLRGTYVAVEPFHLDRYLDEQIFRYENRATKDNPLTDADRFVAALAQVVGRRVTYKELTGKLGTATPEIF